MRPWSMRFKRQVVSLATVIFSLTLYFSFMEYRWATYLAWSVGYTMILFGLAWSDNKLHLFFRDNARSLTDVIRIHSTYLLTVIVWIWLTQYSRSYLPSWITEEGGQHESWLLIFVLAGVIAIWWLEQSRLTAKAKINGLQSN